MTEITIAPTSQADLEAVLNQARATFEEHRARFPKAFPDGVLLKLEEIHRDAVDLAGDHPSSFCACLGGKPAGYVLIRKSMVYDIGVFPRFRQKGVARALVLHAIGIARERGFPLLFASVWDGNENSHRLFQSAGFEVQPSIWGPLAKVFRKGHVTIYRCDPKTMPR